MYVCLCVEVQAYTYHGACIEVEDNLECGVSPTYSSCCLLQGLLLQTVHQSC